MDHEWQVENKSGSQRVALWEPRQWHVWRNIEDFIFHTLDTKIYFDMLKSKGKITVRNPKNSQKLKYEKKENFYQFHQRLGHPNGEVSRCDRDDPRVDQ